MKRTLSVTLALLLLLTGCSQSPAPDTSPAEEAAASETAPAQAPSAAAVRASTPFDDWASNTFISTGSNYMTDADGGVTFRTYLPMEEAGELEYRFYFSNTVDSTWERGRYSYAGKPGGDYKILSARIADGGISPEDELTAVTEVTFDGGAEKAVASGETFWSDSVVIDIPEGHYLVWEWTVEGVDIPCVRMTELAYSFIIGEDGAAQYNMDVPLPQLIGAKRSVQKRLTCFGDSITQGAQTSAYGNAFWAARIAEALGSGYSVWNCGLGYARASDAVIADDWRGRVKSGDVVTLAFGTNDLAAGQYGKMGASSAEEIEGWLRTLVTDLQDAGCEVILFNLPPFDFDADTESIRQAVNAQVPTIAEETGCAFFDWNALLEDPDSPGSSLYGGHPDDAGCEVIADAFLEQFGDHLFE